MKLAIVFLIATAGLALTGCASNQGGSLDENNITTGTGSSGTTSYGLEGTRPAPVSSPTFRPGMNPQDIRDPVGLTLPQAPRTVPPPEKP